MSARGTSPGWELGIENSKIEQVREFQYMESFYRQHDMWQQNLKVYCDSEKCIPNVKKI